MLANIVITMAFSNVRLVSRWLPRLGATRSISMSPTLQSNTSLASEGRTIFQMLRNDASVVAIVIGMVSIASYTLYSNRVCRNNLGNDVGFKARKDKSKY